MATDTPLHAPQRGLNSLLKQEMTVKQAAAEIVEKFAVGPHSPMDGSLHPALHKSAPLAVVCLEGKCNSYGPICSSRSDSHVATRGSNTAEPNTP